MEQETKKTKEFKARLKSELNNSMLRMLGTLTIVASNAASRRTDFLGSRSASPVVFLAYR